MRTRKALLMNEKIEELEGTGWNGFSVWCMGKGAWNAALLRRFGHMSLTYGEIVVAITLEIQSAATDAELRQRGAGLTYIIRRLRLGDDPCPASWTVEPKPRPPLPSPAAVEPERSEG